MICDFEWISMESSTKPQVNFLLCKKKTMNKKYNKQAIVFFCPFSIRYMNKKHHISFVKPKASLYFMKKMFPRILKSPKISHYIKFNCNLYTKRNMNDD